MSNSKKRVKKPSFAEKFKDRLESISKDGMFGIVKNNDAPLVFEGNPSPFPQPVPINYPQNTQYSNFTAPIKMQINGRVPEKPKSRQKMVNSGKMLINNGRSNQPLSQPQTIYTQPKQEYKGIYKPYTVKDYKNLQTEKINTGGLGANIGGRDWEEKNVRREKAKQYGSKVSTTNKKRVQPSRTAPTAEIAQRKQRLLEQSNRYKALNYGKSVLGRPRPVSKQNEEIPSEIDTMYEEHLRYNQKIADIKNTFLQ